MCRFNYAIVPEHFVDTPVYRKGWRPAKPRPRPYPKPASSIGSAAILAARRRSREDARPMVPAPAFQDNYVGFHYAHVPDRRPLDNAVYRKSSRSVKPRPRPYPKPAASIGAAAILAARRRSRDDIRPLVPAPAFQDVNNYVGFPPAIAGYVPEYGDDMEIDATGPFFTPVAPNMTYVATGPELEEAMEVDWEGPSIPSGPSYHPAFNVPYGGPQLIVQNTFAPHPYNPAFPPNAGFVDPPYDPREPLFPTHPITSVVEDNVFVGINVNVQLPTSYPVQPLISKTLNAPSVVTEEHPGGREHLFNELFGDDGEEEEGDEEVGIGPDPVWGSDGNDYLVREHDGDEDEDEEEVEFII